MSSEHAPERAERKGCRDPPPIAAYSVNQFCEAHNISRAHFYRGLREGWGPKIMRAGGRTLVSFESASTWRREREEAAAA